eukprot:356155-Alexandrium_andersonii.AAC.1
MSCSSRETHPSAPERVVLRRRALGDGAVLGRSAQTTKPLSAERCPLLPKTSPFGRTSRFAPRSPKQVPLGIGRPQTTLGTDHACKLR